MRVFYLFGGRYLSVVNEWEYGCFKWIGKKLGGEGR